MRTPQRGQIIKARVLDPNDKNEKRRPLVVVSEAKDIGADGLFEAVAITSTITYPLPIDSVKLPHQKEGNRTRCVTGLTKKSFAICSWLVTVHVNAIEEFTGFVPSTKLLEILQHIQKPPPETAPP